MKIVKIDNRSYAIRKGWLLKTYLDLRSLEFWWWRGAKYFKDYCLTEDPGLVYEAMERIRKPHCEKVVELIKVQGHDGCPAVYLEKPAGNNLDRGNKMKVEERHYKNGNIGSIRIKDDSGNLHNPSGPACQGWYKNGQEMYRGYYIDGNLHNPSGPAYQLWYENGQEMYREYYVDGKELTKEEFQEFQDTVEVTANGRTVRISRKSVEALGFIN